MPGVIQKFFIASMVMWMAPVAILYGFNNKLFPVCISSLTCTRQLSSESQTLLSGFVAVISVNLVIILYIYMAMKEPAAHEHQPDPSFLAEAKASISKNTTQSREKEDNWKHSIRELDSEQRQHNRTTRVEKRSTPMYQRGWRKPLGLASSCRS
uniref:Vacuolar ATPase assembly integral membrane protein VMA21 homolog n=1 Tax=Ananas comosus var. bracteatus TaxID=296719 RepID=A0A6V7PUV9_ANACO|nr:unnamed protein product [Ananas comosus var. bracteatus]